MVASRTRQIIDALPSIGLEDLGSAALMNRVDAKFLVPRAELAPLLERCAQAYHALDINGKRDGRYRTTYFDSGDLTFYRAHLAGRAVRRKLRARTYVDSNISFLEIKSRDNHGRTSKARVSIDNDQSQALKALPELPAELTEGIFADSLRPIVTTNFTRTTLVDPVGHERLTIDSAISFEAGDQTRNFPAIVCIEIKQAKRGPSPALRALQEFRRRESAMSKYCVGVACIVDGVQTHRFQPILNQLYRLERDESVTAGRY